MRVAALDGAGTFRVETVPDPTPLDGELLVAVEACGICGSDVKSSGYAPAGAVLGHEFCGEVVAIGAGVDGWSVGQKVASLPLRACGRCRWCEAGEPAHCVNVDLLGVGAAPGAFAEFVRVAADTTVALAPGLGSAGALVEPLAVGLHAANVGGITAGTKVLVLGGGAVGAAVTYWARQLGAAEIVVSDPDAGRRAAAANFGASGVLDPTTDEMPSGAFDVVIECVGAPGMVQSAMDATSVRGRVVIAGVCIAPDTFMPVLGLIKELDLRFAVYYRLDEFQRCAAALSDGTIDPSLFLGPTIGLDGVDAMFRDLRDHTAVGGKVIVRPTA